jgi:hypothetical protein
MSKYDFTESFHGNADIFLYLTNSESIVSESRNKQSSIKIIETISNVLKNRINIE